MNPEISIIVPVYNSEKYITQCINSILNQDYNSFELLLINDGSTDKSKDICEQFSQKDSRIRLFNQCNKGVSSSRNKGIEESIGKYLLFVDSDDYIEPNCLSQLLKSPEADLTYMSSNVLYETLDFTSYHLHNKYLSNRNDIEKEILHLKVNPQNYVYFGYTWNKLFKADIIKTHSIRFIDGLSFYEDDAFTLEYFQHVQTLKTISQCLYNYRVTSTGLTAASNSCEEFEMLIDSNIKNIKFISNKELYDYELNRLFNFLLQATRQAKKQGRKDLYKHLIRKAHSFYLQYIRPRHIRIRRAYRKQNFWLFKLNVNLHKR